MASSLNVGISGEYRAREEMTDEQRLRNALRGLLHEYRKHTNQPESDDGLDAEYVIRMAKEALAVEPSASLCPTCQKPMTLHCEPCDEETSKWDEWDAADAAAMSDSSSGR